MQLRASKGSLKWEEARELGGGGNNHSETEPGSRRGRSGTSSLHLPDLWLYRDAFRAHVRTSVEYFCRLSRTETRTHSELCAHGAFSAQSPRVSKKTWSSLQDKFLVSHLSEPVLVSVPHIQRNWKNRTDRSTLIGSESCCCVCCKFWSKQLRPNEEPEL